jgi:pimeloyl-ACP methyl ester carboxylesterase
MDFKQGMVVSDTNGGGKGSWFSDPSMEFQFIRQLGSSTYKASSIGECFSIANSIHQCSLEQWVKEFERLGEWQKKDGMERLIKNHVVSGREQLFKASNSFRAAEFYASGDKRNKLGLNSADCFCTAVSSMDLHFENHSIPYNTINLPVYFISPANDGAKRKTLLIVSGFDGTMEEEFALRGLAAIERGFNVLLFAGPGHIDVSRRYPDAYFQPDFEHIIKRVINHFEFRQELDKHHITLMGMGIGSYFALRGATSDPRIKSLILNSPLLDLSDWLSAFIDLDGLKLNSNDIQLKGLHALSDELLSPQLKSQIEQLLRRFGQKSLNSCMDYLKKFSVNTSSLDQLSIPILALISADEPACTQKQHQDFCKQVDAEHYEFSDFEGAGSRGQIGNVSFANAIAYDWLDNL